MGTHKIVNVLVESLRVGDQVVESDGFMLEVVEVFESATGSSMVLRCASMFIELGEQFRKIRKGTLVRVLREVRDACPACSGYTPDLSKCTCIREVR